MRLSDFNFFKLSDEDIALYPATHRDECKLMVLHKKSGNIDMFRNDSEEKKYLTFRNVLDYFDEGDTFIMNDTKVIPARLYGTKEKTDAQIEVFLLRELNPTTRLWDVLVEPARKIRIGNKLFFDDSGSIVAEVVDNTTSRGRTIRFINEGEEIEDLKATIFAMGEAPLPYYITDRRKAEPEDLDNFQCIYAQREGAVTAPCSGMHFSREMMKIMEIKDINTAFVTMHTSLANFNVIEVEDLAKHKMDSEQMIVDAQACDIVNKTKLSGHRLIAVGTSVVRVIESAVGTDGLIKEYNGWTSKFIFPPYHCGVADCLIGNFFHPLSTMLMVECAFAGYDLVKEAYTLALENGYKFGCYGDAMLILND